MHFVVSPYRALDLTVSVSLPSGVGGFRRLSSLPIFSDQPFDCQYAILRFTREPVCPLFQLF